ncbi:MAG: efflux RND transporter periplasmic adaptor subunit [Holophaga sp.]|nr:efflux RND transporter periplasmic adaptor subunit [Holophaga sp.]
MDKVRHPDAPAPAARPARRMVVMLLAVGLFLGLLVGFNVFKGVMIQHALTGKGEPAQTVSVVPARMEEWQPTLEAVGTVRAVRGADLAFEVSGVVAQVPAKAGSQVKAGQPLATLDDSTDLAQLRQLQAVASLAEVTYERTRSQFAAHTVSQADLDNAEGDMKAKRAGAQAQAALVAKKHLVAPFAGQVGIVGTSPGSFLNPGAVVVTLQQLDNVYVDFFLPQKDAGQLRQGQGVSLAVDAYPGRAFKGKVTAVNPRVDNSTRNIQVEATFSNPGHTLLPGMFTRVSMEVGARQPFLTLPQTAITYNPYGALVFLAKAGTGAQGRATLTAQQVFVTTGSTRGDQVAVLKGLEAGAQVVSSGGLKLRNGTPLLIDNRIQPANDANPAPQEQ